MPTTSEARVAQTRIAGGVWEGLLTADTGEAPGVVVLHDGRPVEGVSVQPVPGKPGQFAVRVPIPLSALNEGVQTFLLQLGDEILTSFTLVAGQALDGDIRAELNLLRAELDLLKRSFRRHCAETQG